MFERLAEGSVVMVVGMGVVFLFLVIMVFSMGIMSKIVGFLNKIFPEKTIETKPIKRQIAGDEELIAVAIAAIKARN